MDSKKTNLTPELKEIYDRVMNTSAQAKPPAPAAPPTAPPAVAPPAAQNLMAAPPAAQTSPSSMPDLGVPVPPGQAAAAPSPMPPPNPSMPPIPGMPEVAAMNPAEEALTSAPARPLNNGASFAMKGKAKDAKPETGKKKMTISKPILIILGLAFIGVWGVFWAIIFGLIQR